MPAPPFDADLLLHPFPLPLCCVADGRWWPLLSEDAVGSPPEAETPLLRGSFSGGFWPGELVGDERPDVAGEDDLDEDADPLSG